jgi:hypothetical protein
MSFAHCFELFFRRGSTGDLFREILKSDGDKTNLDLMKSFDDSVNTHQRAVDLVLGPQINTKDYRVHILLGGDEKFKSG